MKVWKLLALPAIALIGSFILVPPERAAAQVRCAIMEPAGSGGGSTPGRYWQLINNCPYNVVFTFTAGWFGGGVRNHAPFVASRRTVRMFVPNPQPHRYNVARR